MEQPDTDGSWPPARPGERIVARVLDLAVATVFYGLWLLYMISFRG